MIIAVSGTPGTGKSSATKIVAKKLDANLISLGKLASSIKTDYDQKRKTRIVSIPYLQRVVNKNLKHSCKAINIIEGNLAHMLKADIIIILRTSPPVLEKRLSKRRYTKKKINENIQAEILDAATIEALQKHKKIYEVDTSKLKPEQTADIILKLFKKHGNKKYLAGKINWTEKYKKYLLGHEYGSS